MEEIDFHNVYPGTRVQYKDGHEVVRGEVTIVREGEAKVIFDSPSDLEYTYYPLKDLTIIDLD